MVTVDDLTQLRYWVEGRLQRVEKVLGEIDPKHPLMGDLLEDQEMACVALEVLDAVQAMDDFVVDTMNEREEWE